MCICHIVITDCRKLKKYDVGLACIGIMFIPSLMKIGLMPLLNAVCQLLSYVMLS
jgi:hypothetical protein